MPAEVSGATATIALAAFAAALFFLPVVLLVAAPFLALKILLKPRPSPYGRVAAHAFD